MLAQAEQKTDLIQSFVAKKYRNTQSFSTKTRYENNIKRFYKFLQDDAKTDIYDTIKLLEQKKIDPVLLLDDFYTHLRNSSFGKKQRQYSNSSIRSYLTTAKEFLRFLGFKVYNEDVKQVFRMPPKQENSEPGLETDTIIRVLRNSPPKLQVAILMCCASGIRDGELVQLRVGDIDFQTNPVTVNLRAEIVKGKIHPRKTHLTAEAVCALKDYLTRNKIDFTDPDCQEKFVFLTLPEERLEYYKNNVDGLSSKIEKKSGDMRRFATARTLYLHKITQLENQLRSMNKQEQYDRSVRSAKHALISMLVRAVDSVPDLAKRHENNLRDIHFHSFRYFFKTIVTDYLNSDFAEALMGHRNLKTTYYKKNDEQRRKFYGKIESYLTISDTERIKSENQRLKEEKSYLESKIPILVEEAVERIKNSMLKEGWQIPITFSSQTGSDNHT